MMIGGVDVDLDTDVDLDDDDHHHLLLPSAPQSLQDSSSHSNQISPESWSNMQGW